MSLEFEPPNGLPLEELGHRRIAAIVLPELLCEAARSRSPLVRRELEPLGVVFLSEPALETQLALQQGAKESQTLSAVNFRAWQLGVRIGQTVTEGHAELSSLRVETVGREALEHLLDGIVEVAQSLGSSATYDQTASPPDTVWLDVTGTAHLFGGEEALARELQERVRLLGHTARVVIAPGPELGRAIGRLGRLGQGGVLCVAEVELQKALDELPLCALPELQPQAAWFARTGILTLGQLRALPAAAVSARLGPPAGSILELLRGQDKKPLLPLRVPEVLRESQQWEEAASGLEPLFFVMRGLLSRLSARLESRGQVTSQLLVVLSLERSSLHRRDKQLLEFEIPVGIWRESELSRLVQARLERLELSAPVLGIELQASALAERRERQLGLGSGLSETTSAMIRRESELPLLLTELEAEVGRTHVGILEQLECHRPEAQSSLVPWREVTQRQAQRKASRSSRTRKESDQATRLFAKPISLSVPLSIGSQFALGRQLFTIEKIRFAERLDGVEWWTPQATHRDYSWAWLRGENSGVEALVYVDRRTGQRFLQALYD